jgi:hypothetical protein
VPCNRWFVHMLGHGGMIRDWKFDSGNSTPEKQSSSVPLTVAALQSTGILGCNGSVADLQTVGSCLSRH